MTNISDIDRFAAQVARLLNDETVSQEDSVEASKTTLTHLLKMSQSLMSSVKSPEHTELFLNDIRVASMGYVMSILHLMQQHGQITAADMTPVRSLLAAVASHYVDQSVALKEVILRARGGRADEEIPN